MSLLKKIKSWISRSKDSPKSDPLHHYTSIKRAVLYIPHEYRRDGFIIKIDDTEFTYISGRWKEVPLPSVIVEVENGALIGAKSNVQDLEVYLIDYDWDHDSEDVDTENTIEQAAKHLNLSTKDLKDVDVLSSRDFE